MNVYSKEQIDSKFGTSVDSAPTENSTNLVTSGGVYTAINSSNPVEQSFSSVSDLRTWFGANTRDLSKNYILSFNDGSNPCKIVILDWFNTANNATTFICGYGYKDINTFMYSYTGFRFSSSTVDYQSSPGSYSTLSSSPTGFVLRIS